MKIMSIVGARPQFIKAAPVSALLRAQATEVLVHTGQHYDPNMSDVFFDDLQIPKPEYSLGIGSGSHAQQTGKMLEAIERVILKESPDWLLVYGDTNSTLAGALAAAKLHCPIAHVEAGLRSFNRKMPEEVNRILTDHCSSLLFCTSTVAVEHLVDEGIIEGVHIVGDVMRDCITSAKARAQQRSGCICNRLELSHQDYCMATIHRAENTDDPDRMAAILDGIARIPYPVVWPVHPRTRRVLSKLKFTSSDNLQLIAPLGYLDSIELLSQARLLCTDSGGMQKEAYWLGTPCLTLRDETEWVETVTEGANALICCDPDDLVAAVIDPPAGSTNPEAYGPIGASERIVSLLLGSPSSTANQ